MRRRYFWVWSDVDLDMGVLDLFCGFFGCAGGLDILRSVLDSLIHTMVEFLFLGVFGHAGVLLGCSGMSWLYWICQLLIA